MFGHSPSSNHHYCDMIGMNRKHNSRESSMQKWKNQGLFSKHDNVRSVTLTVTKTSAKTMRFVKVIIRLRRNVQWRPKVQLYGQEFCRNTRHLKRIPHFGSIYDYTNVCHVSGGLFFLTALCSRALFEQSHYSSCLLGHLGPCVLPFVPNVRRHI